MSTPSIPGVHRDDLADAIRRVTDDWLAAYHAADAALAYIATHHECAQQLVNPAIKNGWLVERVDTHTCGGSSNEWPYAHESGCGLIPVLDLSGLDGWQECDREHADEWVEVDADGWDDVPEGARVRTERQWGGAPRFFVHRDDLPDPDRDAVERMAKAIHASYYPNDRWEGWSDDLQGYYRKIARTALAAYREEGR